MRTLAGLLALAAVAIAAPAQAADINLTTEEYKPFNYTDGDKIVGFGAEQVFEIMNRAGLTYEVEMAQWSRAIGLAEREANYCVFTAAHTEERDPKFLWVEPLNVDRTLLIKMAGTDVNPASIDDAKAYTVGTQSQDYTESLLQQQGFPKIDAAKDMETTLKKLEAGRIDLVAVSEAFYKGLKQRGIDVETAVVLSETVLSMACNPGTDAANVKKMQDALKSMIDDGTQEKILAKYQ
ncbi:transporter substrate-binding domain-containing protein [Roseibium denhamense]|uniref:Amino acid ABC transporter substrate-binding protein, PAAT family n=2 Tax=Roseibium denhamense TaxID=76305 RepID=A0ABY1PID4_9HYPH|nr:transporter substrate-binding domain-containing protein [Roseibium denhamense]SMP33463.1 amino acid ABC transporter substrate-binding protein, PAAT family [Roseibium denhamense]